MDIYGTLNKEQREAVFYTEGPLLILAGAGSGKTRVLTHRIAYLIDEMGVNPWNILAITFTNKAAGEMRERVDRLVGFGSESIWVSTFHSACVRILRRYIDRLGFDRNFTIYDADDQKTLMKDICKMLQIDTKKYKESALLSYISSAKNDYIAPQEFELNAVGDYNLQKVSKVYWEYQKQLQSNNALDFDDLLVKTVQLLQTQPDILEYYQERFRYIMVDEYQDTNTVQFKLVSLLAGKYRNLCVVGDDDQSIYKFRGANIKNILDFEHVFEDAHVIKLEQNYRSTETILKAANGVISNNIGRKQKVLWTENEVGDKIICQQFDDAFEEANFIASDIERHIKDGTRTYKDHAVLYRTNAQSRIFEEKFIMANIPYKVVGGVNFYARREIKDLLAYLKTIDNGKDDLAVKRIINVPKRGIGLTSVNRVQNSALDREVGFYEALKTADMIPGIGKAASKLESFVALIEHFKGKAAEMSISDLMSYVIDMTGYAEELRNEGDDEAEARLENIDEFISKIVSYEESCEEEPTLSGFLEEVALVADIDSLDENSDYVVLMTLHSAKGLEFPEVYLAGMEDGIFPSYRTIVSEDPTDMEEERRLCYVGITRAQENLTMTCARRRMIRGEVQYNKISRFLKEVPSGLIDAGVKSTYGKIIAEAGVFAKNPITMPYASNSQVSKPYAEMKPVKAFGGKMNGGPGYDVGDRVKHIKFGEGIVAAIVEGGRDYEVTVNFDRVGVKKMFASFAKLIKCE